MLDKWAEFSLRGLKEHQRAEENFDIDTNALAEHAIIKVDHHIIWRDA